MKESEAKTKWCPFAMVPTRLDWGTGAGAVMGNRGTAMDGPVESSKCIGSECMAWRWTHLDVRDFGAKGDYNLLTGEGTDDTEAIQKAIDSEPHGYCGLAGKP